MQPIVGMSSSSASPASNAGGRRDAGGVSIVVLLFFLRQQCDYAMIVLLSLPLPMTDTGLSARLGFRDLRRAAGALARGMGDGGWELGAVLLPIARHPPDDREGRARVAKRRVIAAGQLLVAVTAPVIRP